MREFFRKYNKSRFVLGVVLGIIIGAVVIAGAFYVLDWSREGPNQAENTDCKNLPELPDDATKRVTKVLDGDTFIIEGGHSVRLLGIDADESGYRCYDGAKQKLEELALNKEVKLDKGATNYDQYCRYLRYPFINDKNISLELVKQGLAIARFTANQAKYKQQIVEAEQEAKENKKGCGWRNSAPEEQEQAQTSELEWQEVFNEC